MQAKSLIAALCAITTATSAYAQSAAPATTGQQLSREQVMAEFYAARKAGLIPQTEADFDVAQTTKHVVQ